MYRSLSGSMSSCMQMQIEIYYEEGLVAARRCKTYSPALMGWYLEGLLGLMQLGSVWYMLIGMI